ncbi:MAG: hypothetical protein HRT61_24275, partial [Ekhidna sp.]|nr:hypothetical protein [Ekhidna sp.]
NTADTQFTLFDDGTPANTATIELSGLTAAQTYNLPDASGTLALTTDVPDLSSPNTQLGIGTASPASSLQIGNTFGFDSFENTTESVFGNVIATNLGVDKTSPSDNEFERLSSDPGSIMFLDNNNIQFLSTSAGTIGTSVDLSGPSEEVNTWMSLNGDGSVSVSGFNAATSSNLDGSNVQISGGDGDGSGNGGNVELNPGNDGGGGIPGSVVANGDIELTPRGGPSQLRFQDDDGGVNIVSLQAPGSMAGSYNITLPATAGTNGQVLTKSTGDASNVTLDWTTPSGGLTLPVTETGADPSDPVFNIINASGTAPTASFENSSNTTPQLQLRTDVGGTGQTAGGLGFAGLDDNTNYANAGIIRGEVDDDASSSFTGELVFEVSGGGSLVPVARMEGDGTLSALNSLAIGDDVFFPEGAAHSIEIEASTISTGDNLLFSAGDGASGIGDGGSMIINGGEGFGIGGDVTLNGGDATDGSGVGGNIRMVPGNGGTAEDNGVVEISSTTALTLPNGTTAERPSSASVGMIRYNSTFG